MSRNPLYQFVDTDTTKLEAALVDAYEAIVGHSAQPSSPERIFIAWVASIILQERVYLNHAGNQNIPSRAEGANLDALGELFYQHTRPAATSSTVTMRFNISEAQTSAVLIPKGTRVSNGQNMFWATVEDRYIAAGQTHGDVTAECMTAGTAGNGYLAGQIATIVDVFDYYTSCTNLTESGGGSEAPTDDEFYEQLRQSEDNYSTAGPKGGYIAKAKAVSNDIADVLPNSPTPGEVRIYVLMEDGTIAGQEVKNAVLAACNADETRPLLQGARLTAYELNRAGVDVTLICDNMASSVMQKGWVQAVIVGCDRIAANGDIANKIGTSGVAILARHYGIPFYVLGPTSTIDMQCPDGKSIVIEERDPAEVTEMWYMHRMAPKDVKIFNPAFDVTPNELITVIITEKGIFNPANGGFEA
mgnify:CR=1 FL=1